MVDLYLTHEGDISISDSGGLNIVSGILEAMQTVGLVMKTKLGTFDARITIGNELDVLIGELMTQETLRQAEDIIYRALSGYASFIDKSIEVRSSPINSTQAIFAIFIENALHSKLYAIPFDFQHGVLEKRTEEYTTTPNIINIVEIPEIGVDPEEEL